MGKDEKKKAKYGIQTGYTRNGLPYAKMGTKDDIIINIEALSFKHEPPSGYMLSEFITYANILKEKFTIYQVGRKPDIPEDYSFDQMAEDIAIFIKNELNNKVTIMGTSTGGQIAHYLAADHPELVNKLILISTAYRLSEKGVEIEGKSAEYFRNKQYGRSLAAILDLVIKNKIIRGLMKFFIILFAKKIMGEIKYPNDYLAEIKGDRDMNFLPRLNEITSPTLIISGKEDMGYIEEDVRKTAEGIPNATLKFYEKYGHDLLMFKMKDIAQDILSFN